MPAGRAPEPRSPAERASVAGVTEPERYDIPPERLERWLGRWVERHGEIADAAHGPRAA